MNLKNPSIRSKTFIIFFVLIITFSLTISVLVSKVVSDELKDRTSRMELQRAKSAMLIIENYLIQIKNTAISIMADKNLAEELVSENTDGKIVQNNFQSMMNVNFTNIFSIFLYDINEDKLLVTDYESKVDELMPYAMEQAGSGKFYLIKDHYFNAQLLIYPCVIRKDLFEEPIAYFTINAHLYYMKQQVILDDYSDNTILLILNDGNQIIFGSDYKNTDKMDRDVLILPDYSDGKTQFGKDSIEIWDTQSKTSLDALEEDGFNVVEDLQNKNNYSIKKINGTEYLIIPTMSEKFGWSTIKYMPTADIFKSIRIITYILLGTTFLFTSISLFIAYLFSGKITKPIFILTSMMESYKIGRKLSKKEVILKDKEFKYLFESFRDMVERTEYLVNENYSMKLNKKQMELKVIKSVIDPHFLYNILDSIHWLLRLGKIDKAMEVLHDFPKLLRNMLHTNQDFITVGVAKETTEYYCKLQRFFYNDEIDYYIGIPYELETYPIMPLLIQPLIENAYKYAFEDGEYGHISIIGEMKDNCLIFTISDNGNGISSEELNNIKNSVKNFEVTNDGQYFGLGNVDQRIKIQYGQEYGVKISSVLGKGTSVLIRYPVI